MKKVAKPPVLVSDIQDFRIVVEVTDPLVVTELSGLGGNWKKGSSEWICTCKSEGEMAAMLQRLRYSFTIGTKAWFQEKSRKPYMAVPNLDGDALVLRFGVNTA